MSARTDAAQLTTYLDAGWTLIPLHDHDAHDEHKGKRRQRGKSPLHGNWVKRPYRSEDQLDHMDGGGNVGVRLRPGDLVLDVDPRAFPEGETMDGPNPFKRLCRDVGLDPDNYPTVETGSGGLHLYMTKPADVSLRDSLPDYEGVEFKSAGRQVVSAGSIHPDTKRTYEWDFLRPSLTDGVPPAPRLLVDLVRRPVLAAVTGGGEHDQEQLADMLERLDPEDFRDHSAWLTLMQACHHATAGDGRAEFVEWCTRDPQYADDGGLVGRRWDSLHSGSDSGPKVTYRTLHKLLRDAGAEDVIPRADARDDFEAVNAEDLAALGLDDDGEVEEHEQKGPLERMNDRYVAVMEGSQFRIFWEELDPETVPPRKHWIKAKPYDFRQMLSNRKLQRGDKAVLAADAWLDWGMRRTARGVIFDPERDHEGFLNMWTGWGVQPLKREGAWSMLNDLLFEVLCDGDDDVYRYVLDWSAYMVQHPGSPAEVAVCFQGGKGVGKGTWFRALAALAGKHGMQITSSEHLTGRFNDHLRDVLFLFADEAIKAYDKDGESRLKGLITEPTLTYEGKGRDARPGRNRLHVGMASNEDWFVPMGLDGERRFLLQRANGKRAGQHAWFGRLNDQLQNGGYPALLWDLLERDLKGWAPRSSIPVTKAAAEQKLRNMDPVAGWWYNILTEGELPFEAVRGDDDWEKGPVRCFKAEVRSDFEEHARRVGIRAPGGSGRGLEMLFANEIKKLVPGLLDKIKERVPGDRIDVKPLGDGRAWCYELPSLADCRMAMEAMLGSPVRWEDE